MFYRLTYPLFLLLIILFNGSQILVAQNQFTGYYRFESGLLLNKKSDFLYNRHVIQPSFESASDFYSIKITGHVMQNLSGTTPETLTFKLREAKIDLLFEHFDVTIGQQFIVWGRTDATQIHDIITPMDLSEFLTQEFSDLRQGVTALNINYYRPHSSFQFIAIPIFRSSIFPEPESRWSYFPDEMANYLPEKEQTYRLKDTQLALRWNNRTFLKLDLDLSLYSGFSPQPTLRKAISSFAIPIKLDVTPEYQRANAIMFGAEYRLTNSFSLQSEQAYWLKRSFDFIPSELRTENPNPWVVFPILLSSQSSGFIGKSPLFESMVGFKFSLAEVNMSFQYVGSYITKYDNAFLQEQYYHFASALLSKTSQNQRWQFRLLSRYNINGRDFWVNPDIVYSIFDAVRINAGMHLFQGSKKDPFYGHLNFTQFEKNTFIYVKLTAFW